MNQHIKQLARELTKRGVSLRRVAQKVHALYFLEVHEQSKLPQDATGVRDFLYKHRRKSGLSRANELLKLPAIQEFYLAQYLFFLVERPTRAQYVPYHLGTCYSMQLNLLDVISFQELFEHYEQSDPRHGKYYLRDYGKQLAHHSLMLRRNVVGAGHKKLDLRVLDDLAQRLKTTYGDSLLMWRCLDAMPWIIRLYLRDPYDADSIPAGSRFMPCAAAYAGGNLLNELGDIKGTALPVFPPEELEEFQRRVLIHYRQRKLAALL